MAMTPSTFAIGDPVRVTDGPFANFAAEVRDVEPDRLKVAVTLFGRPVPIDVEPWQVERAV
jgi:transcriptional antiterminator NusG